MNKQEKLAILRRSLERARLPHPARLLPLGVAAADRALGGGLMPGALHEVRAADWSAGGFAACLAIRAAGAKPLFWVRPDHAAGEYGGLHPLGLLELGGRPEALILVRARTPAEALAAGHDILACPEAGALLLEIPGTPKCLDLVASRRLGLAAAESGVTALLLRAGEQVLRAGGQALPSAAQTRWHVATAPSGAGDADAWGRPSFTARLDRNRLGPSGCWTLTWDPEDGLFRETPAVLGAPHPGLVAAAPSDRPADAQRRIAL